MSKLTLSADRDIIHVAKEYAELHNTSVSAMFARYIQGLTEQSKPTSVSKTSTLTHLSGAITLPKDQSYDDLRRQALNKRYGV